MTGPAYEFGGFLVDSTRRLLFGPGGEPLALTSRAFDTLFFMCQHPGQLLEKAVLMEAVWPNAVVEENNLNQAIFTLRRALKETPGEHRFIVTVPGRGYRFVAPVRQRLPAAEIAVPHAPPAAAPAPTTPEPTMELARPEPVPDSPALPLPEPAQEAVPVRRRHTLWFASLLVAVVALVVGSIAQRTDSQPGAGSPVATGAASVAVLPFTDLSETQDQQYFSEGLAEEVIAQLGQMPGLRVVGRTSSFSFRGGAADLRRVGRSLGVNHILEGSVRKARNRVRVTTQLVHAASGTRLWSAMYDRDLDDVFLVQEEIAGAVAKALSVQLSAGASEAARVGTRNVEAYDAYLAANTLLNRMCPGDSQGAIRELERAVQLDPGFARAWAALASAYASVHDFFGAPDEAGIDPAASRQKTQAAAMRAVELAPDSPYVLTTAGKIAIQNRDWAGAEQRLLRALELTGGADYEANMVYGSFLTDVGRPHEAIRHFRRARVAEPLLLRPSLMLEGAYLLAGEFKNAEAEADAGRSLLGDRILQQGAKMTRALATRDRPRLEQLLTEEGTDFNDEIRRNLDDPDAALALLHRRTADPGLRKSAAEMRKTAHWAAYFGDSALAVEALRLAFVPGLNVFYLWRPDFDSLRTLPEFKALLRELGLVGYWSARGNWGEFCTARRSGEFDCRAAEGRS